MNDSYQSVMSKLARHGVVSRDAVKNNLPTVRKMERLGFLRRVRKRHRILYELTPNALPLLEAQREILLAQARQNARLEPRSLAYRALLEDIRFLDVTHPVAQSFVLLGNWDLHRPVARFQLALAQERYYLAEGLH